MKEYVVWGIAPGDEYENVLYTRATTAAEAGRVAATLEREHGCRRTRVDSRHVGRRGGSCGNVSRISQKK